MEAKELMISDWVIDKSKKAQVTSLTCDGIIETTASISNIEVVKPIPLSPEILKANGFEYFKGTSSYVLQTTTASITLLWDYWYKCFCWHEAKIRNVHELQHALRMCGLNELADNFKLS